MIRLIDETDPKRALPYHLIGKQILIRDENEIFMATVVSIADVLHVFKGPYPYKIIDFDGWAELPIIKIDEEKYRREIDRFFLDD